MKKTNHKDTKTQRFTEKIYLCLGKPRHKCIYFFVPLCVLCVFVVNL